MENIDAETVSDVLFLFLCSKLVRYKDQLEMKADSLQNKANSYR